MTRFDAKRYLILTTKSLIELELEESSFSAECFVSGARNGNFIQRIFVQNFETEEQNTRRAAEKIEDWHRSSHSGALPRQQGEALIS